MVLVLRRQDNEWLSLTQNDLSNIFRSFIAAGGVGVEATATVTIDIITINRVQSNWMLVKRVQLHLDSIENISFVTEPSL